MLILRTPKGMTGFPSTFTYGLKHTSIGWTGPLEAHGHQIEGSWRAHQIPLTNPFKDKEEFAKLEEWLLSYKPRELFDEHGVPHPEVLRSLPSEKLRMG